MPISSGQTGDDEMSAEVGEARVLHEEMLLRHMSSPNDTDGGMRKLETIWALGYWPQWNLRNKRRASARFIRQIKSTYYAVLENSARSDLTKLKTMAEIEALKGQKHARLESLRAEAEALLAELEALSSEAEE